MERSRCIVNAMTNTAVVTLVGEVDRVHARELAHAWEQLPVRPVRLVLDLTDVSFLDAGGLTFLLGMRDDVLDSGGQMFVWALSQPARRLLEITGVLELFPLGVAVTAASLRRRGGGEGTHNHTN